MIKANIERIDHLRARCNKYRSMGDHATVHRIDALQEIVSILTAELAKVSAQTEKDQSSNAEALRPASGPQKPLVGTLSQEDA